MTDENATTPDPNEATKTNLDFEGLDPGKIAVKLGLEQVLRIHEIERTMLSRAIQVIHELTKQSAEEIIAKLSKGLNGEYDEAVETAKTATQVAKLYIPQKKIINPGL